MNYIKKPLFFKVLTILVLLLSFGCSQKVQVEFNKQNKATEWKLKFSDPCNKNWQNNWFLDGEIAKVEYNKYGMDLIAGPINRNNAHHSVLWTKQSFEGDIKIEYDYTRTDSTKVNVNILFIQATGNGVISKVTKSSSGYGHHVVVDHGFGYKTLYGHMSKIDVKKGQKVTRGQKIGEVGSTGTSTAPHLHYEVISQGNRVNPIHYCMDGLSPEEYQQLANMASTANQSFD